MTSRIPECMGNYDFNHIAAFAKKRYIEGCNTVDLMEAATSDREKEEIVLVSLLDVDDDKIRELRLSCKYADQCKAMDCRDRLKKMIEAVLA